MHNTLCMFNKKQLPVQYCTGSGQMLSEYDVRMPIKDKHCPPNIDNYQKQCYKPNAIKYN